MTPAEHINAPTAYESDDELPPQALMNGGEGDEDDAVATHNVKQLEQFANMLSSAPSWDLVKLMSKNVANQLPNANGQAQLTQEDVMNLKRQCSSAPAVLTTQDLEKLRRDLSAEGMDLSGQGGHNAGGQNASFMPMFNGQASGSMENMLLQCNIQLHQLLQQQQLQLQQQQEQIKQHQQQLQMQNVPGMQPSQDGGDKPKMVIEVSPPCCHNQWERISKKKNSISLRCRKCKACWKTKLEFFQKCAEFYAGNCPRGDACPHPHIYSRAAEKYLQLKKDGDVSPTQPCLQPHTQPPPHALPQPQQQQQQQRAHVMQQQYQHHHHQHHVLQQMPHPHVQHAQVAVATPLTAVALTTLTPIHHTQHQPNGQIFSAIPQHFSGNARVFVNPIASH